MDRVGIHVLRKRRLMRNASCHVLITQSADMIRQPRRCPCTVLELDTHVPDDRILNVGHDILPGLHFRMMGIRINDQPVLEVVVACITICARENVTCIRVNIDDLAQLARRFQSRVHGLHPHICSPS